uniref:NfeD-like C-terminal domain-containing protein n=1 Tax=Magnetococcus massalia (strain MO-1) TaxID=451514 RepID=A0A1S7LJD1_MAGMO|nr:Conserved membrane protein of unknown function [Candidatus Magnetococcus massalia]
MSFISGIEIHWLWLIGGLILVGLEVFIWSTFLLWLGVAALIMGCITYLYPELSTAWALILYSLLSLTTILVGRKLFKPAKAGDDDGLNDRGHRLVGQRVTVAVALVNGHGKVKVGDSLWLAEGEDSPEGSVVEVVDVKSTVLVVKLLTNG